VEVLGVDAVLDHHHPGGRGQGLLGHAPPHGDDRAGEGQRPRIRLPAGAQAVEGEHEGDTEPGRQLLGPGEVEGGVGVDDVRDGRDLFRQASQKVALDDGDPVGVEVPGVVVSVDLPGTPRLGVDERDLVAGGAERPGQVDDVVRLARGEEPRQQKQDPHRLPPALPPPGYAVAR